MEVDIRVAKVLVVLANDAIGLRLAADGVVHARRAVRRAALRV
jgi:hypothetical protein